MFSETKMKILEKGLDYAPMRRKINERELRSVFEEFCRRTAQKMNLRIWSNLLKKSLMENCGVPTEKVSEILHFHLKSVMQEGASFIKDTIQTSRTK